VNLCSLEYAQTQEQGDQSASPVRNERKGKAYYRQKSQVHTNVDEQLGRDRSRKSDEKEPLKETESLMSLVMKTP